MAKENKKVEEKIITKPIKKVVIKKPRPSQKTEPPKIEKNVVEEKPKEVVKPPRKQVVKKPTPIVQKPIKVVEKKLTKKQIEKQIENEKLDVSVPQQIPKKTENFMVESTTNTKRSDDKYISVCETAKIDERRLISERITKNEIVFSHYAINNEIGYYYYRVLIK